MKPNLFKKPIYLFISILLLTNCSSFLSNTEYVKDAVLDIDYSLRIGDVFDNYKYFKKTEWKEFNTKQGKEVVEFNGYYYQKNIIVEIQFAINKDRMEDAEGKTFRLSYVGYRFINQSDDDSESLSSLISDIYNNKEISYFSWIENPTENVAPENPTHHSIKLDNFPNDFVEFIGNFSMNADFQLAHVLFPLSNGGLEKPAPSKEEWQFIHEDCFFEGIEKDDDGAEYHGHFEIIDSNNISYGLGQPESERDYYLVFRKIEGTWMLVEYIDFDMQQG